MKNKILGILLVMVLAVTGFGLVGCGGKTTPVTPTPTPEPEVPELVDSLVPVAMDETGLLFYDPYTPVLSGSDEVDPEEVTMRIGVNGLEKAVAEVVIPAYVVDGEDNVYKVTVLDGYAFTVGGRQAIGPVEYAYSEGVADDEEEVELVKITLPSTVEYVSSNAFAGCTALEEIVLNNRETVIEGLNEALRNVTEECADAQGVSSREEFEEFLGEFFNTEDDGLYYLGNTKHPYMYLVMAYGDDFYPQEEAGEYVYAEGAVDTTDGVKVTINADCKVIGEGAFANTTIIEVVLPEGLVTIGAGAFYQTSLEELYIPSSVKYIDDKAFSRTYLNNVYIDSADVYNNCNIYLRDDTNDIYVYVLASVVEEVGDWSENNDDFTRSEETTQHDGKEYVEYAYYHHYVPNR